MIRFAYFIFRLFYALLLASCTASPTPTTPTNYPSQPSNPPTVTPVPASDYQLGALALPEETVLLISNPTWRVCTSECNCPAVEGLPPGYKILKDQLHLSRFGMDQTWENGALPAIVFVHGDFEQTLVAVEHLPFTPQGDFHILAAMQDGTVIYKWGDHAYQLATGEGWQIARTSDLEGGCVITDYSSLRNHGVWSTAKVVIDD